RFVTETLRPRRWLSRPAAAFGSLRRNAHRPRPGERTRPRNPSEHHDQSSCRDADHSANRRTRQHNVDLTEENKSRNHQKAAHKTLERNRAHHQGLQRHPPEIHEHTRRTAPEPANTTL